MSKTRIVEKELAQIGVYLQLRQTTLNKELNELYVERKRLETKIKLLENEARLLNTALEDL